MRMHSLPWDSILVPEQKKGVKEKLLKICLRSATAVKLKLAYQRNYCRNGKWKYLLLDEDFGLKASDHPSNQCHHRFLYWIQSTKKNKGYN